MRRLRFTDLEPKPTDVLDMTSLTLDEFRLLVPAVETAFQTHMTLWRLDGKPRIARRYTTYTNCPLPTAEDRLLFILSYLKVAALQVAHGAMFEMSQSNANKWIHVLLPTLHQTLSDLGDLPARHLVALQQRLAELEATVPQAAEAAPAASPFFTMAPNDRSPAPKTRMNKARVIVARKSAIR
jgi:2'-5' RNA ligase